jgi:hypothetical protein
MYIENTVSIGDRHFIPFPLSFTILAELADFRPEPPENPINLSENRRRFESVCPCVLRL